MPVRYTGTRLKPARPRRVGEAARAGLTAGRRPSPARKPTGKAAKSGTGKAEVAEAVQTGRYEGGEAVVENQLPPNVILPTATIQQIIAAGIEQLKEKAIPLLTPDQVYDRLEQSISEGQPLSLIRLGDGELLTLAQRAGLSDREIRKSGKFLSYAGVTIPDLAARDLLVEAVRHASIVGVPKSRRPHFQPLMRSAFSAHGIALDELQLTESTINYSLYDSGLLQRLLRGRKVLLIGNVASRLGKVLQGHGVAVSGIVSPVNGMKDVHRRLAAAGGCEFDIALVAAGVPAVVIADRLARYCGKVAIDIGHLADLIARRKVPYHTPAAGH